jgi:hypothetical protein
VFILGCIVAWEPGA